MGKRLLMGNEAIALGALRAGVRLVSGYPGTPSSEILETVARERGEKVYVEWSVNEKAALEVAAGAAYAGARSMVTMKQVGLNVASDPLMSLAYVGVKGGMVVVSADDPGPISSQTEQDTRRFAAFAKLPVFDPSSPEEAYQMIGDAFEYSEKYETPVLFRPTTRVCHACASIEMLPELEVAQPEGFIKDSRWVIFPRLSYNSHLKIEARDPILGEDFSGYRFNKLSGEGRLGIISGGVSWAYTLEALREHEHGYKLLKLATPNPFPEKLALEFLDGLDEVLCIEELDPVLEDALTLIVGRHHLSTVIRGKHTGDIQHAGENTVQSIKSALSRFLGLALPAGQVKESPNLPIRPPVLCAGCPHRASFYAVKQAMRGKKAVFCGDIGCYTLGNAAPLDMVDTCLCMGADVTVAQGLARIEPDALHFSFIGDSTFFHTGMVGVLNAVYNGTKIVLIVLDNSTTAMTGHQPHPGTGKTMMGTAAERANIPAVLAALGVKYIRTVNPLDLSTAVEAVKEAADFDGVSAIVFESPCIAIVKPGEGLHVDFERCNGCKKCIRELGCPALIFEHGHAAIEPSLCTGCGLCKQVCPFGAIGGENDD